MKHKFNSCLKLVKFYLQFNFLYRFGLLERMPIITHNTLNAAAQPIERDTSINEGFTAENKAETNNLLGDLEAPPLLGSSEQVV